MDCGSGLEEFASPNPGEVKVSKKTPHYLKWGAIEAQELPLTWR
tara:strand:- start:21 stop:152 length:132 start_codon:yes stop_codon:yes gene_type:complete